MIPELDIILKLEYRETVGQNSKLANEYGKMQQLLDALNKKTISENIATSIKQQIEALNSLDIPAAQLAARLKETRHATLKLVEKQLKLVPQKHYLKRWMALGMSAFGLPFGVVFSITLGNFAFMGLGLPIGMGIGIGIGTELDKQAEVEGRQLAIE